ncbi:hypothetical protein LIER_39991 [Lithospermum erythrorhizon]|uniref:Uncharacterized protein n=1 Tax=Lithospermum erythrorhizon TaxID=34254 RepID=A0AAV3QRJ7_LITER
MAINKSHIRSVSLPSKSHLTIFQIEEELNKLKTWEPSKSTPSNGICSLVELYKSMDDLLNLPQTIQAFSKYQNTQFIDELLECPVKFLDICGITRDVLTQFRENIIDLQSSLRRRKGDLNAKRCITTLKKMDQAIEASTTLDVDQETSSMIRVFRGVNSLTMSVFQSVLTYLSKTKPSKWSFSRLIVNKGKVACEGQQVNLNELEVDNALSKKFSIITQQDLGTLEASIEGIEKGLESMYRCLIRSRTLLLNVVSC